MIKLLFSLVFYKFALMNTAHHISQLLYRFQCVTVPGFGAFLAETIPAKINENNQNFYPPKKVISFNSYLKNNDGLLANHIAVSEKISYDQAVLMIDNEVYLWKNELENHRFLLIKNIGEIRLNEENSFVFSPSNHFNYLTSSFGLSAFVSPTIKREVLAKVTETEKTTIGIHKFEPKFEETEDEPRRYLNPYLKYAAIFILSLGTITFGYKQYINQEEQRETLIVEADVQKEINNKIQEATFFISNPTTELLEIESPKTLPFHIMAGAFRSDKNANKELNLLIAKGFNARVLNRKANGLIPVVYGSFPTYTEAQYKMTQIQESENKEAWLLIEDF